ncbi:uncharacterized protein Z519_00068 [Cladophialophora bantiana CBS 173.52]|uniref:Uncharacterized protein n=1 Tax=Cladophialophora bantiana (strain ATCC 10958 / CBS 173.52 / CDC B-1940 / NIH 8579) TaxID=1442370 RepID=A0A0D2HYA1_CLAB1|nr:uncharacterized protein Z519_00068 [Cladophialophora bantiana CBS 173.52]KIW98408.1 hypothetical protein Z519_00068 [Cladophialophora bantiana CBS 173.52]
MNVPKFKEREKALEDDYIRRKDRTSPKNSSTHSRISDSNLASPFGTDWAVLWLGHCGAAIDDGVPPGLIYADDTSVAIVQYVSWSNKYLVDPLPEGHRQTQISTMTVCTFGRGVTKSSQEILSLLARGVDEVFDVALSNY